MFSPQQKIKTYTLAVVWRLHKMALRQGIKPAYKYARIWCLHDFKIVDNFIFFFFFFFLLNKAHYVLLWWKRWRQYCSALLKARTPLFMPLFPGDLSSAKRGMRKCALLMQLVAPPYASIPHMAIAAHMPPRNEERASVSDVKPCGEKSVWISL